MVEKHFWNTKNSFNTVSSRLYTTTNWLKIFFFEPDNSWYNMSGVFHTMNVLKTLKVCYIAKYYRTHYNLWIFDTFCVPLVIYSQM